MRGTDGNVENTFQFNMPNRCQKITSLNIMRGNYKARHESSTWSALWQEVAQWVLVSERQHWAQANSWRWGHGLFENTYFCLKFYMEFFYHKYPRKFLHKIGYFLFFLWAPLDIYKIIKFTTSPESQWRQFLMVLSSITLAVYFYM